jgi:hypothetical protein
VAVDERPVYRGGARLLTTKRQPKTEREREIERKEIEIERGERERERKGERERERERERGERLLFVVLTQSQTERASAFVNHARSLSRFCSRPLFKMAAIWDFSGYQEGQKVHRNRHCDLIASGPKAALHSGPGKKASSQTKSSLNFLVIVVDG